MLGNLTLYQASGEEGIVLSLEDPNDPHWSITDLMYIEKDVTNVTVLSVPDRILKLHGNAIKDILLTAYLFDYRFRNEMSHPEP